MAMVRFKVDESVPLTAEEKEALLKLGKQGIDYSDIPETRPEDWSNAVRGAFYRPVKKPVSVRIDTDVLMWLKSKGKGYQTRINQILRQAMLDELEADPSHS